MGIECFSALSVWSFSNKKFPQNISYMKIDNFIVIWKYFPRNGKNFPSAIYFIAEKQNINFNVIITCFNIILLDAVSKSILFIFHLEFQSGIRDA
jgi:hypothetical protein